MSASSLSKLRALAKIINDQVDAIESHLATQGLVYPDLDKPMDAGPPPVTEMALLAPEVIMPSMLVVAACGQLAASVKIPAMTMIESAHAVRQQKRLWVHGLVDWYPIVPRTGLPEDCFLPQCN